MSFPVECTLAYDPEDESTHDVTQQIFRMGQVRYNPRESDGRRIVDFPTREMQEEAIGKNPAGDMMFVIPTDIVGAEEEEAMRRIVRDELQKAGLISAPATMPSDTPATPNATTQAIGLARENGLEVTDIEGSGKDGQVTKGDVEKAIAG